MAQEDFINKFGVYEPIPPTADLGAAGAGDEYNMQDVEKMTFLFCIGSGAGSIVCTIEACSDAAGTGNTAIAFKHKKTLSLDNWDTGWTADTTSGFTTAVGGAGDIYAAQVDARDLPSGKNYVRPKTAQGGAGAVVGCVIGIAGPSRYYGDPVPARTA